MLPLRGHIWADSNRIYRLEAIFVTKVAGFKFIRHIWAESRRIYRLEVISELIVVGFTI